MRSTIQVIFLFLPLLVATGYAAAQSKPDLVVSQIAISGDGKGQFLSQVSVTVTNVCVGTTALPSYVLLTFKQSERRDAKTIYYVGSAIGRLRGGETFTQNFDVERLKIGVGRHIVAEVDPYKKVPEADEENNWRTLYPENAGAAEAQCLPQR